MFFQKAVKTNKVLTDMGRKKWTEHRKSVAKEATEAEVIFRAQRWTAGTGVFQGRGNGNKLEGNWSHNVEGV